MQGDKQRLSYLPHEEYLKSQNLTEFKFLGGNPINPQLLLANYILNIRANSPGGEGGGGAVR